MKFVLLGPPGAGKGTHAKVLSEKYGPIQFAAGDIFRRNIREKTELGLKAKSIIEKGELVADEIVNAMMFDSLRGIDLTCGFLLDGYPRTLGQAQALDSFLKEQRWELDGVINFNTSEAIIIDRLSGRRVAPSTGRVYHIRNMPPKREGICDETGESLVMRKDDQPETVKHRLEVYHKQTEPLIAYYKEKNLLYDVPGDYDVEELQAELRLLFERLNLQV